MQPPGLLEHTGIGPDRPTPSARTVIRVSELTYIASDFEMQVVTERVKMP